MAIAAPGPVFGLRDESAMDGVAVDVLEFFDALRWSSNVEVIVTSLPEASVVPVQLLRDRLFQRLDRPRQGRAFGFGDEKVDVFGHDDVADHVEPIAATGLLERALEDVLRVGSVEEGLAPVTSEGDEVETVRLLITN